MSFLDAMVVGRARCPVADALEAGQSVRQVQQPFSLCHQADPSQRNSRSSITGSQNSASQGTVGVGIATGTYQGYQGVFEIQRE